MKMEPHFCNLLSAVLPARCKRLRRWFFRLTGARIEKGVSLCDHVSVYGHNLAIGCDTWVSLGTVFVTGAEAFIRIGTRCDIGPQVSFVTGSHEIGDHQRRARKGKSLSITIGDGCWIGARCMILGGTEIGDGSIVAAGSVVLPGIYPPDTLLSGVPAAVKKTL